MRAANEPSSTPPDTYPASRPPAYAPAIPAAPKTSPVRHRTRPWRAWGTRLTRLVTPTMNSEPAAAWCGVHPAT